VGKELAGLSKMVSLNSDRTTSPTFFHTHLRWYQQPKNPPPALRSSWYQSMYFIRSVGCLSNACMPHSTPLVCRANPAALMPCGSHGRWMSPAEYLPYRQLSIRQRSSHIHAHVNEFQNLSSLVQQRVLGRIMLSRKQFLQRSVN
jgi:hypothetical protein